MSTPSLDKFQDKLIELVGAGSKIGLAAAMAMANPDGVDELGRGIVSDQIKGTIENLRHLQATLERIGQKKR